MNVWGAFLAVLAAAGLLCAAGCDHLAPGDLQLANSTRVPFTLHGNHIYVRASVNGAPYAFIFDSGGTASLTPDVSKALKLETTGRARVHGVGQGDVDVDLVRVSRLDIGSLSNSGATFLVLPNLPLESPFPGIEFGGILGREIFEKIVVTIDYQHSMLTFTRPADFHPDPASVPVMLTLRHGALPNIPAAIDGHAGDFDIDVGSSQALMLTPNFAESTGLSHGGARSIDDIIGRGVGGPLMGTVSRARSLQIASLTIPRPLLEIARTTSGVFAASDFSGNIGAEILRRFTVTLDAPDGKLYLRPNSDFTQPFVYNRAGINVTSEPAGARVANVIAGSPAAVAGLRPGDKVLTVNGRTASAYDMAALHDVWYGAVGSQVSVQVLRDGKTVTARFRLRDLI